jgi:hypothetical protein
VSRARARAHGDPVAVTSSGDILVNAACFDDVQTLEEVLAKAKKQKGGIFVGFVVGQELPLIFDRVHDACTEGAAFVVGRRQRKRRKR